jgi:integrase
MSFAVASSLYWDQVGKFHQNATDTEGYLAWLQGEIGKGTLVSAIDSAMIAKAVAKRRGDGVANRTVNASVTEPLRAILRRAGNVWGQAVQRIKWSEHLLEEAQERVREATPAEEATLLDAMRDDYVPPLRFALLTGCRQAEIVGLTWARVDFFNDQVTVTGKRGKSRTIPLTAEARALLWSLKDHHAEAVFTYAAKSARDGRERGARYPITVNGFKTAWRRYARAKVKDFRFHDTRHTAATRLVRATGNLKLAQRLLGHTEIATTARYAHVTDADLRAGMEAMNPTKSPTAAPEASATDLKSKGNQV